MLPCVLVLCISVMFSCIMLEMYIDKSAVSCFSISVSLPAVSVPEEYPDFSESVPWQVRPAQQRTVRPLWPLWCQGLRQGQSTLELHGNCFSFFFTFYSGVDNLLDHQKVITEVACNTGCDLSTSATSRADAVVFVCLYFIFLSCWGRSSLSTGRSGTCILCSVLDERRILLACPIECSWLWEALGQRFYSCISE